METSHEFSFTQTIKQIKDNKNAVCYKQNILNECWLQLII